MLQEFLRRGEKMGRQTWLRFKEGSRAELGVCSLPVWVSAYGGQSSKRPSGGFFGERWLCLVTTKKFAGKSASQKQKIRRGPTPKNPPQNLPTNPPVKPESGTGCFKCTPGFSRLRRRFSLGGVFRAWDTLWLPSGHGRGSDCAPFQTTLLVKNVRFDEDSPKFLRKNIENNPPRASANPGSPRKNLVSRARIFPPKPRKISYRMHGFQEKPRKSRIACMDFLEKTKGISYRMHGLPRKT